MGVQLFVLCFVLFFFFCRFPIKFIALRMAVIRKKRDRTKERFLVEGGNEALTFLFGIESVNVEMVYC